MKPQQYYYLPKPKVNYKAKQYAKEYTPTPKTIHIAILLI